MRKLDEIIIHCSATRPEWMDNNTLDEQVKEINRWHREERGWSGIGYHFVVGRRGGVAQGRPVSQVGAHVKGHNRYTIGVCLIGGHGSNENDDFFDHFTNEQNESLRYLIKQIMNRYPTVKAISGHNNYAAKACPGFRVDEWYRKY